VGEAPVGEAPVGEAPVGEAPVGEAPVGRAKIKESWHGSKMTNAWGRSNGSLGPDPAKAIRAGVIPEDSSDSVGGPPTLGRSPEFCSGGPGGSTPGVLRLVSCSRLSAPRPVV